MADNLYYICQWHKDSKEEGFIAINLERNVRGKYQGASFVTMPSRTIESLAIIVFNEHCERIGFRGKEHEKLNLLWSFKTPIDILTANLEVYYLRDLEDESQRSLFIDTIRRRYAEVMRLIIPDKP